MFDARSDAEAGIILRFHDPDNYLVALYTPSLKAIYLHDRKNGQWGSPLGHVPVPEIGPKIQLTAATCGDHAALVMTDGTKTYCTPVVKVSNTTRGKVGVWLFQIGDRQEYDNFEVSHTQFGPVQRKTKALPSKRAAKELPLVLHEKPRRRARRANSRDHPVTERQLHSASPARATRLGLGPRTDETVRNRCPGTFVPDQWNTYSFNPVHSTGGGGAPI